MIVTLSILITCARLTWREVLRTKLPYKSVLFNLFVRIIRNEFPGMPVQMPKSQKPTQHTEKTLDEFSEKRGRGRPANIRSEVVFGRAQNYRTMLTEVWPKLRDPLLAAGALTEEEVTKAFEIHAQPYAQNFVPGLASSIIEVIRERKFPTRPKAQVHFLADSLAGRPNVGPRRSRDICTEERAKESAKSPHKILRKEFYVECSCGYKGPARNDACRKCGAAISFLSEMLLGVS
jgi:hypothetical protein